MSRKKYNGKLELFQELYENLEELREQLDMALGEIDMTGREQEDFQSLVLAPYDALLSDLETFNTDMNNGVYDGQDMGVEYEED